MKTIMESARIPAAGECLELSVVLPCLNEADTLEGCISRAWRGMKQDNIAGEVIVADNGSTDNSVEIALVCGARVVNVPARGYGCALMAGITAVAQPRRRHAHISQCQRFAAPITNLPLN